jgi:Dyp-type peroxidase family
MGIDLDRTLSWTKALAAHSADDAATLAMLNDLQGNILKGHGRRHTANLFLRFAPDGIAAAKAFLASIGREVTTALDQLTGATLRKTTGKDAGPFIALLLSAAGYRALGLGDTMPNDAAFLEGMAGRPLADPPREQWEATFSGEIHAMLLLAADGDDPTSGVARDALHSDMLARIAGTSGAVMLAGEVLGNALFNADGNGIEHFGYVDGRSQPLMLEEDIAVELPHGPRPGVWNPAIPLSQVLVRDPGGELAVSCGSYFVFRQLEQDVRGFKERELALAEHLGGIGELAGASVVGRFENGTPVVRSDDEIPLAPGARVDNAFTYEGDPKGLKCPYAGHIRKTNPRTDSTKVHLMARRGIPYGTRSDGPNDDQLDNKPTGGVGLLFMAYQASIVNQFEFTQRLWANNAGFDFASPDQPVGIDPIIGQPAGASPQRFVKDWGSAPGDRFDFSGFVTMKGGEYFFAPAISQLKRLA